MKILFITLGLCLAGAAFGEETWEQLTAEGKSVGLDAERFEALVGRCRKAGLSVEDTRTITDGLFRACEGKLPAGSLYTKIDEGLTKSAGAERIARAAGLRVQMLERANSLVVTHRADDSRGRPGLVAATAHALESTVPDSALARLLSDPNTDRPGWLMAAIEGLETLHAQGFPIEHAERLMVDALSRGLRRYELLQAIDLILREHREGSESASIVLEAGPSTQGGGGGRGNGRQFQRQ